MATLNYNWQNVASWSVSKGSATVTFWVDAKLSSQNVNSNYSIIDTRLNSTVVNNLAGSGYNYQLTGSGGRSGSTVWTFANETILTGQFRHNHNSNGTATNVNIHAWVSNDYWKFGNSIDAYVTLPTIPRYAKMTNAIGNFNDEQTPWFTFSNPANTSMSCWLEINPTGEHLCIRTFSGTSGTYTWTLTEEERNKLRAKLANVNGGTGKIRIGLYSTLNGSTQASYIDRTFTIINANPIFNNFTFEDTNPITTALTGNNQNIITNYSNITATVSTENKAEAIKEATMSKYRLTIGETSADINYSADSSVSVVINKVSSGTFNMYAIDSRANSTMITKLANNIINYENVIIDKQNSSIIRNNSQIGEKAILKLNGTFWNGDFGDVVNTITSVTYRFKKTDSDIWIDGTTVITPTITENNFTFEDEIVSDNPNTKWDLQSSYDVEVTINDELSSATVSFILNSGIPTLCLDKEGVGIMCAYDSSLGGYLQIGGERIDNVYSTDERKVGTWINNKPIYRKVITDTMNSGETTKTVSLNIDDSVDEYLMVDVRLIRSGTFNNTSYTTSGYNSSSDGFNWYFNTPQTKKVTVRGYSSHPVRPYNFAIIVEYTKTND